MQLIVTTFNIENLFTRFDFSAFYSGRESERSRRYLPPVVNFLADFDGADLSRFDEFKSLIQAATVAQDDDKRQHTALAIAETNAHIVCLQEVDSISALSRFNEFYLNKTGARRYEQLVLHEGNDFRGIDVAAMAVDNRPLMSRSHATFTVGDFKDRSALIERYPEIKDIIGPGKRGRIFRRDCLELEVTRIWRDTLREISIFICHFKSMSGGRKKTIGVRQTEALAVKQIIETKFDNPASANWLIVGDLNDFREEIKVTKEKDDAGDYVEELKTLDPEDPSGLDPLLDDGFAVNLVDRRDVFNRWTHYYPSERNKTQLDYVLASPALAEANEDVPEIVRVGTPFRVPNTRDYRRFPRIGWDRPKASDHCPVTVDLTIPVQAT